MLTAKFLYDGVLILTINQMQSLFQNAYHMHENFCIMGIFYIVNDRTESVLI